MIWNGGLFSVRTGSTVRLKDHPTSKLLCIPELQKSGNDLPGLGCAEETFFGLYPLLWFAGSEVNEVTLNLGPGDASIIGGETLPAGGATEGKNYLCIELQGSLYIGGSSNIASAGSNIVCNI